MLIRVEACGICHTDLKKIEYNLLPPPRIYGHETAGVVAAVGEGVTKFSPGDRVIVFHHIPCGKCFYCGKKLYAQCPVYKKVGVTAGIRTRRRRLFAIRPRDGLDCRAGRREDSGRRVFRRASFRRAGQYLPERRGAADPQPGDVVAILGQGPIGLIFTMMVARTGRGSSRPTPCRSPRSWRCKFGADAAFDPRDPAFRESDPSHDRGPRRGLW